MGHIINEICHSLRIPSPIVVSPIAPQIALETRPPTSDFVKSANRNVCDKPRFCVSNGEKMSQFVTIGYGNEGGDNSTAREVRNADLTHDASLVTAAPIVGRAGQPVQIRNPNDAGLKISRPSRNPHNKPSNSQAVDNPQSCNLLTQHSC